jgi:hypothetical protein
MLLHKVPTSRARWLTLILAWAGAIAGIVLVTAPGEAHKLVTSKYTYVDDVYPVVRERCSHCHVSGGVGPMSLTTYEDALSWAESIRVELLAAEAPTMPALDPTARPADVCVQRAHTGLSSREFDVMLEWATGGAPRGSLDKATAPIALQKDWPLGKPDLVLQLPAEYTLAASRKEDVAEFVVATHTTDDKWVKAIDLLPGNPAIVRSATIALKASGATSAASPPAEWCPQQKQSEPSKNGRFELRAGSDMVVRVHYMKTWTYDGKAVTDRSAIGLYFESATRSSLKD